MRGSDFAHKVHAEAWPVFDKWIERVRVYLDQHKAIADLDPNWYVEMLTVAKAQSWPVDKTRELVAEGLHKYPYYRFACAAGDLPTARKLFEGACHGGLGSTKPARQTVAPCDKCCRGLSQDHMPGHWARAKRHGECWDALCVH